MVQGDVWAVIFALVGSCISAWALTMAYGLLFPAKSEVAKSEILAHPWKCVLRGVIVILTIGLIGFILVVKVPNPAVKLVGWMMLLSIFAASSLGMAGIAMNVGERIRKLAPEMSHYAAFSRGAAFLIVGCILPIVGWLAFGPVLFLAAIGAGVAAARAKVENPSTLISAETV